MKTRRHQDHHDPTDPHQRLAVLGQGEPTPGDEGGGGHEDHGEAKDEQQRPEDHPVPLAVGERLVGQPGDVAEEPRDERQHAGRRERHQAGEEGHGHRHRQGAGGHRVRGISSHQVAFYCSARTSSTSPVSVDVVTAPLTRAAIRPCAVEHERRGRRGDLALQGEDGPPPGRRATGRDAPAALRSRGRSRGCRGS